MNGICQDKFALRHEVVRYAETHGLRAAAHHYECSRTTVRLWFRRWKAGDDALADHSRRPHHSPQRTGDAIAAEVIAARKKAPCFGARRLVDLFELPIGKGAAHRILRDEKLIRPRPRKHQRKADLRAIKAAHPPLLRLQMDTKYLNDIPHYFPQMQRPGMPRFQYTIRCEALGALFLAYSCELSKTYATLALQRVLAHLRAHGLDLTQLVVRTDLGTEFDGDTVHYRPDGFHGALTAVGATHRFNPPAHPNANADVESSHATIEPEFFDLESFRDPVHFLAAITTYQHFFNFARKNRSRDDLTPADLLALRAPHLSPKILLLPPVLLDAQVGQDLSGPPAAVPDAQASAWGFRASGVQCAPPLSQVSAEIRATSALKLVRPHCPGDHGAGQPAFALRNFAPVSRYHACSFARIACTRAGWAAARSVFSPISSRRW